MRLETPAEVIAEFKRTQPTMKSGVVLVEHEPREPIKPASIESMNKLAGELFTAIMIDDPASPGEVEPGTREKVKAHYRSIFGNDGEKVDEPENEPTD